ncbi:hypothetical protein LK08_22780 [Streptomyces sp. MUSC 125]|nr:hypothetical protein LK08_22780 [Streptomyces sp. MUSC 125]
MEAAFAALEPVWSDALCDPSPAAVSWRLLASAVASRLVCPPAAMWPGDTLILRHRLGLPPLLAAETMGVGLSEFTALYRAELRATFPEGQGQRHMR